MKTEDSSIVCKINDYFNMPISYIKDKHELKKNISTDLELIETIDSSCNSIYSFCFNTDNDVSKKISEQMINYYTSDINFLKDNQKLIKDYVKPETRYTKLSSNYKNIVEIWNELKIESGFREKYYYVDWETIEFLNKSEIFLQFMSLYNLFSPIFSLIVPIIILIIPFFILKMKGIAIDINELERLPDPNEWPSPKCMDGITPYGSCSKNFNCVYCYRGEMSYSCDLCP